jgi:hypothetical protein
MDLNRLVPKGDSKETKEEGLQKLFTEQLQDLYNAETQLIKALPKLEKAASSMELKAAFGEHLQVTGRRQMQSHGGPRRRRERSHRQKTRGPGH